MFGGRWIKRIDDFGAWALLVVVPLFVLSGWGMTKTLIDPALARFIHTRMLPVPLFFFFLVHILRPVRERFKAWNIFKNDAALDAYVYILALIMMGLFLWLFIQ
jgi:hypothetical protein